jgi:lipoate synthase
MLQTEAQKLHQADPTDPDTRLAHPAVTFMVRGEIASGGAGAIAERITAIRRPDNGAEVLSSDLRGKVEERERAFAERTEVLNWVEILARLERVVRPSAGCPTCGSHR